MISYKYASSRPWAITEEYLKLILEITSRTNPSLEDIEARMGKKLENRSRPSSNEANVRVIPVIGPIVRYGDIFSDISGATSLSSIKADFISALEDETVSSILFDIDSPGGEASGIHEFTELIYNARGKKPIISYVSDMACSAAYWIASATDEIVCDETATLGSIGCVAVIQDTEEKDAKEGIKNIKFVSSNSPNKRPDITTDEGKALIQEQIDTIGDIFISKVARNRSTQGKNLSSQDVVDNFNQGGVLIGKDAVEAGLADSLGSLESTLIKLQSGDVTSLIYEKETSMKLDTENKENKVESEEVIAETSPNNVEVDVDEPTKTVVKETSNAISLEDFNVLRQSNSQLEKANKDILAKFKALEEANSKLEQDAIKQKAENVAISLKDKMLPSQKENFIASYIQATNDDKKNPVEGFNRVENLLAVWESTPSHKLTEELLEDTETLVNEDYVDEKDSLFAQLDAQARAFAKEQNKKTN